MKLTGKDYTIIGLGISTLVSSVAAIYYHKVAKSATQACNEMLEDIERVYNNLIAEHEEKESFKKEVVELQHHADNLAKDFDVEWGELVDDPEMQEMRKRYGLAEGETPEELPSEEEFIKMQEERRRRSHVEAVKHTVSGRRIHRNAFDENPVLAEGEPFDPKELEEKEGDSLNEVLNLASIQDGYKKMLLSSFKDEHIDTINNCEDVLDFTTGTDEESKAYVLDRVEELLEFELPDGEESKFPTEVANIRVARSKFSGGLAEFDNAPITVGEILCFYADLFSDEFDFGSGVALLNLIFYIVNQTSLEEVMTSITSLFYPGADSTGSFEGDYRDFISNCKVVMAEKDGLA